MSRDSGDEPRAGIDADTAEAAHAAALRLLARRELSAAQVRVRLGQRGFGRASVDEAVTRLIASGALDDGRVARAWARARAAVKRQGRLRVLREIEAIGIARDIAKAAVDEVFGDYDEAALLEQALSRRLRPRMALGEPAVQRRLHAALVRQGFEGAAVGRAIRARAKQTE